MFLEKLSRISNRIHDALALCLVDKDGILIESVSAGSELDFDLLAAELVTQAENISNDHRDLAVGEVEQLTVATDRLTLMVSSVGNGYYLMLVLGPDGNQGKARFELRRSGLLLEDDLAV